VSLRTREVASDREKHVVRLVSRVSVLFMPAPAARSTVPPQPARLVPTPSRQAWSGRISYHDWRSATMRYEFIVRDAVSDDAAAELPELSSTCHPGGATSLYGSMQDEADVLTILTRLRHLGLLVLEMRQLPD
jgi:hypothetical protein